MTVGEALQNLSTICIPKTGFTVEKTVAEAMIRFLKKGEIQQTKYEEFVSPQPGHLFVCIADDALKAYLRRQGVTIPSGREWIYFDVAGDGSGFLASSRPAFLYALFRKLIDELISLPLEKAGRFFREASFSWLRSSFDLCLTQYGRMARGFDREAHIQEYARLGFTHIEVNALAEPFPCEQGVPGEFYSHFYTYCPALDQFVESRLNRGTYPAEYLQANLSRLKENAHLAVTYGLTPGLLCFEPRSVPDSLLQKYPMLRGPRVDHPFRSFKPRFALTLAHPVVHEHYAELMNNLMSEVPELGFMAIWSNDSGSGFEHTQSLYAGRNGGAFLIREWKDNREISRVAADNIARFFRILRDAASRINPAFRVITRLESFYGERESLWPQLADRIDVEVNSLLTHGWENNYHHPIYPDVQVLGSALHNTLREDEKPAIEEFRNRGSRVHFYHFFSSHGNHEPLLGIPFPWLVWEKLSATKGIGADAMASMGGINPPGLVPYAVNQEVLRAFQFGWADGADDAVQQIATRFVGNGHAGDLVATWREIDEALRHFVPLPLYSGFGLVWQRLWVRPLVPDIDRIPEDERAYYERFMCTTSHNPNRVDLARDVLFELVPTDYAAMAWRRIDEKTMPLLAKAIKMLEEKVVRLKQSGEEAALAVFADLWYRARGLSCHCGTIRNTAVWIEAVHRHIGSSDPLEKDGYRLLLVDMIGREIENCRALLSLWRESPVAFMLVSAVGETPFIHGDNVPQLLEKKIALMERHRNDEPYVDPNFMFRISQNLSNREG